MIIFNSAYLPFCCMLLLSLLLGSVSAESIGAAVGKDVILPCRYDAKYYGKLPVCWTRGTIPNSGCGNEVIKSDGTSVTSRLSERYLLIGHTDNGDVSLTIRQVQESDSGVYGCRVDIPGWFNDQKHHLTLTVVPAPPHQARMEVREVKERTITVRWTPGRDGGRPITSYRIDQKSKMASWAAAVTTSGINPALTQVTLVDMRPAKEYNIRMFAINSVGMSSASNVLSVVTKEAAPEGPPLDVQLEAVTSRSIKVTWKAPKTDLRNGVLRGYTISCREYDDASRQYKKWHHYSVIVTGESESFTLNHLKPLTTYNVMIVARTNAGTGPLAVAPLCKTLDEVRTTSTADPTLATTIWEQSTTTFTPVPPDPPVVELIEVKDKMVSLHWTAGFDGSSPITSYDLEYKAVNASWDSATGFGDFSPNVTDTTLIEMHPSIYNIRMFAWNSVGTSEASNILTVTIEDAGQQWDAVSTTISGDTLNQAVTTIEKSQGGHLVAIVVPLVLVVLIVAIAITWQLLRNKMKKGSFGMSWLTNGAQRFTNSEPVSEL